MKTMDFRSLTCIFIIILCLKIPDCFGIRHARNLIWAQTPSLKIGVSRIVGIEGDPSEWVPNGNVQVRHIGAPHVGWQFKALSFNYRTQTLYWTEGTNKRVQGLRLNGTTETETIFVGTSSKAEGLAVDWISGNIYWTDSLYKWIIMAPLGAKEVVYRLVVRTGISSPHGIAVHPRKGYLFWTDSGDDPKIEVSDLLGQNRRTIINTDIESPRGITIDFADQMLYWVDSKKDTIESAEFNGNTRKVVAFQTGTIFFGIAAFQNYLFVTEQLQGHLRVYDKKNQLSARLHNYLFVTEQLQGHLRVYDKKNGNNEINYQLGYIPDGIAMYEESLQEGNATVCDCDQICVVDPLAGPICRCGEGYILQDDGVSCVLSKKFGTPSHIYAIRDAICQYPVNLPDMSLHNVSLESQCFLQNGRGYFGLAFDARDNMLYYSENVTKSIGRINMQVGESGETIMKGVGEIQAMALDWVSGNLFWTDLTYNHISMARKDGMHPTVLVEGLDRPTGIAVYPSRGEMYWTEQGSFPMIYAASMDGSNRRPLVNVSMVGVPNHLYLDYANDRLYWADSGLYSIRCVDLNTLAVDIIYDNGLQQVTFYGLSIFQTLFHLDAELASAMFQMFLDKQQEAAVYIGYVIWTDKDDKKNGIHAARLDKQEKVRGILHPHAGLASGLVTFDVENQPEQKSPCEKSLNLCDHICIPTSNVTYICACGIGYMLHENLRSCSSSIKSNNYVLAVDSYQKQIYQVEVTTGAVSAIPLAKSYKGVAIDLDPIRNTIYWTDNRLNLIMTSSLDGLGESVLFKLDNNSVSDGIAVDAINRLLFFTCTGNNVIVALSLDKPGIYKTIINESLDQPRDIIVHPEQGKMYWTDWGIEPKLEVATMDGANRSVLQRFQNESWPNAIALDTQTMNIYWVDARSDVIGRLNLNTLVAKTIYQDDRAHFFGMSLMGGYLYLTDWFQKYVRRISLDGNISEQVGPAKFARLNGIVAYNRSEVRRANSVCVKRPCSNLCLPVSARDYVCACSDEGKFAKIPCRELNVIDISVVSQQKGKDKESSPAMAIGLSVSVIVVLLVLVVVGVYIYNKKYRSTNIAHDRLVEDTSRVDTFYRITFPDATKDRDEPNFDSGIENPSFSCSTEDVQVGGNLVRYSPM